MQTTTRAVLDSSSAVTMVTKHFSNSLQMKHHSRRITIGGVGSHSSSSTSVVNLKLSPAV